MDKLEHSPLPYSRSLILLTAPSGAGKTTLAHRLLKEIPALCFSLSATTRLPRPGEIDGRDYYFLDVAEFEQKIARGEFVEYEMVYQNKYYGTLSSELDRIWRLGKYPLRVVDVVGAVDLKRKFGGRALSIFIQPPSFEVLQKRLEKRGTENDHSISERIKRAHLEMDYASQFDHVVINDDLDQAVKLAEKLITGFLQTVS